MKKGGKKRGRKAKPTRIKAAAGNPGKRPLNKSDLMRLPGRPEAPEYLDERARKIFNFLVDQLAGDGILAAVDAIQLGNLAAAYGMKVAAHLALQTVPEEKRFLVNTPNGGVMQNPLIGIINTQAKVIDTLASQFGLSPAARAGIDLDLLSGRYRDPNQVDPLEALLDDKDGPAARTIQ